MKVHVAARLIVSALLATACSAAQSPESSTESTRSPSLQPTSTATAACPVTRPVPPEALPPEGARPIVAGGAARDQLSMYGNDALWVVIPPDGVAGYRSGKFLTVRLLD